jgi:hypothetical protein
MTISPPDISDELHISCHLELSNGDVITYCTFLTASENTSPVAFAEIIEDVLSMDFDEILETYVGFAREQQED